MAESGGGTKIAEAFAEIRPQLASGFAAEVTRQTGQVGAKAGAGMSTAVAKSFDGLPARFGQSLSVTESVARRAGDAAGDSLAGGIKAGLDKVDTRGVTDSFDRVGDAADAVDTRAMGFRDTITGLQDTFKGLSDDSLGLGERLLTLGMGVGDLGSGIFNFVVPAVKSMTRATIANAVGTARTTAATIARSVAEKAAAVATHGLTLAQKALNVVMRANPLGLVITAAVALGGAIFTLYKRNERFREVVQAVWKAVREHVGGAIAAVGDWLGKAGRWLGDLRDRSERFRDGVARVFGAVARAVGDRLADARGSITTLVNWFGDARDTIARIVGRVIDRFVTLKDRVSGIVTGIGTFVSTWGFVFGLAWTNIMNRVRDTVRDKVDAVVGFFRGLPGRIKDAVAGLWDRIKDAFKNLFKGFEIPINLIFGGDGLGVGGVPGLGGGGLMGIPETAAAARLYRAIGSPGDVISGARPGARTLSGNLSYHALFRALDFTPIRAVAELLHSLAFRGRIKELISPWPELGVLNGRPWRFSDSVQAQHDGRTNVPHIHLAAEGGALLTKPTVILAGETARARAGGGEIVSPVATMEDTFSRVLATQQPPATEVRVFIGERELTDIVRVEMGDAGRVAAQRRYAGAR